MNYHDRPHLPAEILPNGNVPSNHHGYGSQFYSGDHNVQDESENFDFRSMFSTVYNRKWMILSILVLGLIIATVLALRTVPLYKAKSTVEIQKQETQIIEGAGVNQPIVADAEYISTQFELLKSRALAERVAEKLNLPSDPRYANQDLPRQDRLLQSAEKIVKNLRVYPVPRSRVLNVEFVSPHPAETARITNALIETFIQTNLERRYNTTAYAREFLEERLATTKSLLEEKERELVRYANDADILELTTEGGGQSSLDVNSVLALNEALSDAERIRINAEQAFKAASSNPSNRDVLDSEVLQALRVQLADLSAEYQQNLSIYRPEYPDMQRLQTRINAVRRLIASETSAITSALESDFRAAQARERSLRSRVSQLSDELQEERDRRIEYTILKREVDTNRSQYDALLQRMKEISISSGIGTSQVSVIDRALIPNTPFEPNISRALFQAAILSLALGIALSFSLNYIDDTIKTPEAVNEKLGIPAIGLIPKVGKKKLTISEELNNPKSPIIEAYLSARTALDYASSEGAPRSLLVTSTRPSEGKSSTVLALANAYANNGSRVLVIDADMRKPSFYADLEDSIGLAGLLTSVDEEFQMHVLETNHENIALLPSGGIPPNPAALLSAQRLRDIIYGMQELYDIVIVDSPPVLSFADAPLLGAACQGALVVIEAGNVRTPAAQRTLTRLYESRTNIIGAVLTKFDARYSAYDYNYYYSSYGEEDVTPAGERNNRDKRRISIAKKSHAGRSGHDDEHGTPELGAI